MKKLAAWDFEDLMQCSLPVFEGLLDQPHDDNVQKLLFTFAEWHALAKLRMHTDETLNSLDRSTKDIGRQLRHFEKHTCTAFDTKELPKEEAARTRRQARKKTATTPGATASSKQSEARGPKKKVFNMMTYKLHSMGDYVRSIRRFGTTDSYSTQPVSFSFSFVVQLILITFVLVRVNYSIADSRFSTFVPASTKPCGR